MHEISIALSILDIVLKTTEKEGAKRVTKISLQIGAKSGVVIDALEFALQTVIEGTLAEKALFEIESIPLKGKCTNCHEIFFSSDFLICPECNGFGQLISGQELKINSIEVE